ncbi:hypothetical protein FLACOL_02148 [Flavobacterium columnare]|uniref:Uncharacterized protein n=2 Tax=Flavobacterium TaxID=237 RepID=A0ABW8PRI4_9FLAO|nr:hypothetical protein [Flavobacterium columnare]SPE78133.1 hypothetical protein FLACOL_02148 [Flavobacterium columnare]
MRVNLTDGGANGLDCKQVLKGMRDNTHTVTKCPWDNIPANVIQPTKPIIKQRTRSFADLEKLAIDGLNYHWGRNKNHTIAKDVKINGESFEVYVNAINKKEKAIGTMELVYNTNDNWMRSGNPGSIKDPMTVAGNIISRQAICYNVGYMYYFDWYEFEPIKEKKWSYRDSNNEDVDFKFTAAHEIGHELLNKYGGTIYSYGHKGSVNSVTQSMKDNAPSYPLNGEIDIMPYYPQDPPFKIYQRYALAEKDLLGLIWLTRLEVK